MSEARKPLCAVNGMVAPSAMCGKIIVGRKYCGAESGTCEHQRDENLTKEGVEVKVGQVWQNLDKRMAGRKRIVIAVQDGKAHMDGVPKTKVSIRRMHKSSTGWALVSDTN